MSELERERLQHQGLLGEKDLEAKKLAVRIDGLRRSLREELDPFTTIKDLRADVIVGQAADIADALLKYHECLNEIALIKRALGR